MVEVVNQSSLSTYAMRSIITSFLAFIGGLSISIQIVYYITTNLNKKLSKAKPNNKFIVPMVTITIYLILIVLDIIDFLYDLKYAYYELYMKALHLHVNVSNLAKPDINFWVYGALNFIWLIICIYALFIGMPRKRIDTEGTNQVNDCKAC